MKLSDGGDQRQAFRKRDWLAIAGIALLGSVAFIRLFLMPTGTLFSQHSDMLAMHLPMKHFLVHSYQQDGELPNWCPYSFAGMPFSHDVQLAPLYPFHLLLYSLSPDQIGSALSWLTWLHVVVAGWGMYFYARFSGQSRVGAMGSACAWMFAGKWMLHLIEGGHSIIGPLAWLPWVLWLLHAAVSLGPTRTGVKRAILAGLVFGMMVLGTHPQILFYSGISIAVSLLIHWWVRPLTPDDTVFSSPRWRLVYSVVLAAVCLFVALGFGAAQLLPALEATPMTSRAHGVPPSDTLPGGVRVILNFFGPAIVAVRSSGLWEDRGGFAFTAVFLATIAWVCRREEVWVRRHVWLFLALFIYAVGGAILFQSLPGFRLFRQATRMILIAALPMAWLVGAGLQTLIENRIRQKLLIRWAVRVAVVMVLLCGGLALRTWLSGRPTLESSVLVFVDRDDPFCHVPVNARPTLGRADAEDGVECCGRF